MHLTIYAQGTGLESQRRLVFELLFSVVVHRQLDLGGDGLSLPGSNRWNRAQSPIGDGL